MLTKNTKSIDKFCKDYIREIGTWPLVNEDSFCNLPLAEAEELYGLIKNKSLSNNYPGIIKIFTELKKAFFEEIIPLLEDHIEYMKDEEEMSKKYDSQKKKKITNLIKKINKNIKLSENEQEILDNLHYQ